ncbi:DNA-directed RNA polymerase subunit H [Candidatus Micrarchaeota archaeon]|nr:DNA-directed RNA polymerase subunit H [Candidatus Micrarchaeota archaeon]
MCFTVSFYFISFCSCLFTKKLDVLSHSFNPKLSVVSEGEKTKVLKKYGITDDQLPKLYSSDPVALALKAAVGSLIKVERNDGTGSYTTYRIVVE